MKKTGFVLTFIIILTVSFLSACTLSSEKETPLFGVELTQDQDTLSEGSEGAISAEIDAPKANLDAFEIENQEIEQEVADAFARVDILLQAKVNYLNVRSEPNSSAKSLGTLAKGDYISFHGEENGWYTTFYKEKKGYVSTSYCDVVEMSKANERVEKVIDEGKKLLGYPYVWGSQRYHWGNGNLNSNFVSGEFDCSALMQYMFFKVDGTLLGLTTREQVSQGQKVAKSDIQRGDLLFFTNSSRRNLTGVERVGHVALYLGDNLILHTASDYACIEAISSTRWSYYISASRI